MSRLGEKSVEVWLKIGVNFENQDVFEFMQTHTHTDMHHIYIYIYILYIHKIRFFSVILAL